MTEKGYFLAQGENRPWVILDPKGGVHSAPRYAGVGKAEFERKLSDLKREHLPSVQQVQDHIREQADKKKTRAETGQGGSGSVGSVQRTRKEKASHSERAQTFKNLNEALRQERIALRKAYDNKRQTLWKGVSADYQTKREALKNTYKPRLRTH